MSPNDLDGRIVLDADGLLVVNKPHGVPSTGHTLKDPDSLQHALIERYGQMIWAVHQLDADTSGVNVFVRERKLVQVWQARLKFPNARKRYLAVCSGHVAGEQLLLDSDIDGRSAGTLVQTIAHGDHASLLVITLQTGRTHQIRIHLQRAGHPLLGEAWYRASKCLRHTRQALHASSIELRDPTGMRLHATLPPDLAELCERLGLPT